MHRPFAATTRLLLCLVLAFVDAVQPTSVNVYLAQDVFIGDDSSYQASTNYDYFSSYLELEYNAATQGQQIILSFDLSTVSGCVSSITLNMQLHVDNSLFGGVSPTTQGYLVQMDQVFGNFSETALTFDSAYSGGALTLMNSQVFTNPFQHVGVGKVYSMPVDLSYLASMANFKTKVLGLRLRATSTSSTSSLLSTYWTQLDEFGSHNPNAASYLTVNYANCSVNAICTATGLCQCNSGYSGNGQNCTSATGSACSPNPCQNGGTCNAINSVNYTCSCTSSWTGNFCDQPVLCPTDSFVNATWPPTSLNAIAFGTCVSGQSGSVLRQCGPSTTQQGNLVVGVWQQSVTGDCLTLSCPSQDTPTANWISTPAGQTAQAVCNPGYTTGTSDNVAQRLCTSTGQWQPNPSLPCLPLTCATFNTTGTYWPTTSVYSQIFGICSDHFAGSPVINCTYSSSSQTAVWSAIVGACVPTALTCSPESYQSASFRRTANGTSTVGVCSPGTMGNPTRFCNSTGFWSPVVTSPCLPLPVPEQYMSVTFVTSTSVSLQWVDAVNTTASLWRLTISSDGVNFFVVDNGAGDNLGTHGYVVNNLLPFTKYFFRVYAGNAAGYETTGTTITTVTKLPPPTGLVIINTTMTTVWIQWNVVSVATWYSVYHRLSSSSALSRDAYQIAATAFQITGLTAGTSYSVEVHSGTGSSDEPVGQSVPVTTLATPTTSPTSGSNHGSHTGSNGSASPTADAAAAGNVTAVAVGAAVAGVAFIVLLGVVILFLMRRRQRSNLLFNPYRKSYASPALSPEKTRSMGSNPLIPSPENPGRSSMRSLSPEATVELSNMSPVYSSAIARTKAKDPFTPLKPAGDSFVSEPTVLNTITEVSLPGYLRMEYSRDLRMDSKLGAGGAGVIYIAALLDAKLRKEHRVDQVVVKQVTALEGLTADETLKRFHQEVAITSSLSSNPYIVKLIGFTENPNCIVYQKYDADLYRYLANQAISVDSDTAARIASQIVNGMRAMHDLGIIHLDLKTPNVLVDLQQGVPNVVISDFGLARVLASSATNLTSNFRAVIGLSPRYTPPEIFARSHLPGSTGIDPEEERRADVFAFGVILWELLCRQIPWANMKPEQIEVAIRSNKRLQPPPVNDDPVRQLFVDLMKMCWQEEPLKRPTFKQLSAKLPFIS